MARYRLTYVHDTVLLVGYENRPRYGISNWLYDFTNLGQASRPGLMSHLTFICDMDNNLLLLAMG